MILIISGYYKNDNQVFAYYYVDLGTNKEDKIERHVIC